MRLHLKGAPVGSPNRIQYFVMKLPYSKVPRFIQLPKVGKDYYLMFIEDIIKVEIWIPSSPVMKWTAVIASRFHAMRIF